MSESCHVVCNKKGIQLGKMSRDFNVYRDGNEETGLWLLIDREGSVFSDPKYSLENFKYPNADAKSGTCLLAAKVEDAETRFHDVCGSEAVILLSWI
jgi:hypothetical protein